MAAYASPDKVHIPFDMTPSPITKARTSFATDRTPSPRAYSKPRETPLEPISFHSTMQQGVVAEQQRIRAQELVDLRETVNDALAVLARPVDVDDAYTEQYVQDQIDRMVPP